MCLKANNLVFISSVSSCFVSRWKHSFQYELNSGTTAVQGHSPVYRSTLIHCLRSVSYSQAWTYWLPLFCRYFEQEAKGCELADHSWSAVRSICLWNCRTELLLRVGAGSSLQYYKRKMYCEWECWISSQLCPSASGMSLSTFFFYFCSLLSLKW